MGGTRPAPPRARGPGIPLLWWARGTIALEDGEPADPAVFVTTRANWSVGDTFEAHTGRRFLIVSITMSPSFGVFTGVLTVRPLPTLVPPVARR